MDAEILRQFAALGVGATRLPAAPAQAPRVEVWPEAWPTLRLFLAVDTQWRVVGGWGGVARLGLDYGAVAQVADDLKFGPVRWDDLKVMEVEALRICSGGVT